jgi:hypothetical protein
VFLQEPLRREHLPKRRKAEKSDVPRQAADEECPANETARCAAVSGLRKRAAGSGELERKRDAHFREDRRSRSQRRLWPEGRMFAFSEKTASTTILFPIVNRKFEKLSGIKSCIVWFRWMEALPNSARTDVRKQHFHV